MRLRETGDNTFRIPFAKDTTVTHVPARVFTTGVLVLLTLMILLAPPAAAKQSVRWSVRPARSELCRGNRFVWN